MTDPLSIASKIVSCSVSNNEGDSSAVSDLEFLDEKMVRPDVLYGATIKVKSPTLSSPLYVNINHYTLNEGTSEEKNVPFEIFINGAENDHVQWVSLNTRLITSIWRKGGKSDFIIEDMKKTFDADGGYFIPGGKGKRAKSLVAHIGFVIEEHLIRIGFLKPVELSAEQKNLVESKMKAVKGAEEEESSFPEHATVCRDCSVKAVVRLDNCDTCLNCSSSKCG